MNTTEFAQNPVVRGFAPDPSVVRVEEDYYLATSTFEWWPGVRLYHSRNLANWTQLPSPLRRQSQLNMRGNPTSGGVWAPCLSYCDGVFYLVYTDVKTKKGRYYNNHNYVVTATDPAGEWSEPVYLNSTGFDPSLFHDTDGRKYLVNMRNGFLGVLLQEYNPAQQKLVGEVKNIFAGTEIGYTEGPHLYKRDGWYYLIVAEGGTGYTHCVTFARSKSIWGPYTVDPENPMLHADETNLEALQKCGHADLVDTPTGEWYMMHLCSRPSPETKRCLLGRETALQSIVWSAGGWPRLAHGGNVAQQAVALPQGAPCGGEAAAPRFADDFNATTLHVSYATPRRPLGADASLAARPGWLRLYGRESLNSLFDVTLAAQRQREFCLTAQTRMAFAPQCPEQVAGLAYMYDAMNFYLLVLSQTDAGAYAVSLVRSDTGVVEDCAALLLPAAPDALRLKVQTNENGTQAAFFCAVNDGAWQPVGVPQSTHILTDEHCRGFTGAHVGLYVHDMTGLRHYADFDDFSMEYELRATGDLL